MKKHILLLICFTVVLTSCDQWLDVKPSTQLDREELLSTEKGYAEAVKGVYTQMSDGSLYGRNLNWGGVDVLGGLYQTSFADPFNDLRQYAYVKGENYVSNVAVALVENFWSKLYNAIAGINSILGKIDASEEIFSEDNYSVIKGESIGLRAFLHFELLRLYGDVYEKCRDEQVLPFVIDLTTAVTPELTGEQAITFIITQLEEAVELLENDPMRLGTTPSIVLASAPSVNTSNNIYAWHNRRVHFNYYAAKATLARAYLWKGEKRKALEAALEIIAEQEDRFPWVRSSNLTSIGSETSEDQDRTFATEHIFALNITNMDELIAGYHNNMESSGSSNIFVQTNIFTLDEQGTDPRYRYLHLMYNAGLPFLTKFYQPARVHSYFKYRMPLIRISEMYYIAAECTPNWQDGLKYLETVRGQRGMGSLPLNNVNSTETLQNEIYKEYRKEFMGEGQLWFYFKRHQFTTIPNMSLFKGTHAYIFPRPETEELYGDRN